MQNWWLACSPMGTYTSALFSARSGTLGLKIPRGKGSMPLVAPAKWRISALVKIAQ
jgi:hypothetical protein